MIVNHVSFISYSSINKTVYVTHFKISMPLLPLRDSSFHLHDLNRASDSSCFSSWESRTEPPSCDPNTWWQARSQGFSRTEGLELSLHRNHRFIQAPALQSFPHAPHEITAPGCRPELWLCKRVLELNITGWNPVGWEPRWARWGPSYLACWGGRPEAAALAVPSPDEKGSKKQMRKHTKSCLLELKLLKVILIISGLQPGIPSCSVRSSLPKDKENRASK